jgi:predicted O-methyltransferase YrrM
MDKALFVAKYLKYNSLKSNAHGIHSPFVFDLYNHTIKNKTNYYAYSLIEGIRESLLKDKRSIHVKDLGAGSGSGLGSQRTVKQIASTSVKNTRYSQLLFRIADHFQPKTILEIGTSLGISTMYLAIARSKSQVITIEGSPEIRQIALDNFKNAQLSNIRSIEGNFDLVLPEILSETEALDLVFFDGNHRKAPTLEYFELCLTKATNESVFIFDDIYWSREMSEAWDSIKAHPRVTVTIDLFQMGIIFFRKEQAKQHFVLAF